MSRKIIIAITLLLSGFLIVLVWQQNELKQEKIAYVQQMNEELFPYEQQLSALQSEKAAFEKKYGVQIEGMGTITCMFPQLNDTLYQEYYPLMKEAGYPAVMLLSKDQFPGKKGSITIQQFQEILDAGWGYCLAWDGINPLNSYVEEQEEQFKKADLEMPEALYIPEKKYTEEIENQAKDFGFTILLHHGELDMGIISKEYPKEEEVWNIGVYEWDGTGATDMKRRAEAERGSVVISFQSESDFRSKELIDAVGSWKEEGSIKVLTLKEAYDYRVSLAKEKTALELEQAGKLQEMDDRIRQTEEKIDEIKARYPWKW